MKKILIIIMLATLSVAGMAANRNGSIQKGYTMLSQPMSFGASDTITTSATVTITITNFQQYLQHQTFTTTLTAVSGSPSVAITAYGKVNSGDAWTQIGSPSTWTSSSNNPVTITSTTAYNYNYLKVAYVASGATQLTKISTFEVKTTNIWATGAVSTTGRFTTTGGITISGAVSNINASSNYATNIGTGTTTSAVTVGGASNSVVLNGLNIASAATGVSSVQAPSETSADSILLNPYKALKPLELRVNSASKWYVDSTGIEATANYSRSLKKYAVSDGDSIILDPYQATRPIELRVGGASKFWVDSTGVISTAGKLTAATLIVATDTCLGVQTKSVANVGVLRVTNTCTLNGLSGGVAGQLLRILNTSATTLTIKHNGSGTQKFMISGGADLSLTGQYNALTLTFDGTYWFVTGKGQ